ncbi:MAG: hypothetical protein EBU31_12240, partial [Proteobacteria bacterium]|nr:hypothetical protein [Pseudomonadota bacterium]
QHCCCKNFLKVLKPVSMKSAKTQKASLDPLKISGRCGRLMCCLRYEDETYEELKKRLPKNKSRVGTSEGPGTVIDSKILVQLVLVRLDHNGEDIAVPVEELLPVDACPQPAAQPDPFRGMGRRDVARRTGTLGRTNDGRGSKDAQQQGFKDAAKAADAQPKARAEGERTPQASASAGAPASPGTPASPKAPGAAAGGDATPGAPGAPGSGKKRRRRRGRGGKGRGSGNGGTPGNSAPNADLHSPRESDGGDAGGADADADD